MSPTYRTHSYAYDVWGRVDTYTCGSGGDQVVRSFTYDGRSAVTGLAETTAAGTTTVHRVFDAAGRIGREKVLDGSTVLSDFENHYDDAGRRDSLEAGPDAPVSGMNYGSATSFTWWADGAVKSATAASKTFEWAYDTAGRLNTRSNPWRTSSVTSRDGRGRVTATAIVLASSSTALTESLSWTDDDKQLTYSVQHGAVGGLGSTWTDARSYGYHSQSRRLVSEAYVPDQGESASAMNYQFDHSHPGGLGVRTYAVEGSWPSTPATAPTFIGRVDGSDSGATNGFARVLREQTNDARRAVPVTGEVDPVGADAVRLKMQSLYDVRPVNFSGPSDADWDALLHPRPAREQYNLDAEADYSSVWVASPSTNFTFARELEEVENTYDGEGRITQRIFTVGVTTTHAQVLTWDALGRLTHVEERDANNHGYNWSARYDGLDRRLSTTTVKVFAGTASTAADGTFTEQSWYDPLHEFLEIAVVTEHAGSGSRHIQWKVHGPDASGDYGGFNGLGGLEASVDGASGAWTAYVEDFYGHIVGLCEGAPVSATFRWQATRSTSYGPLPGAPVYSVCETVTATGEVLLGDATAWRGKRQDITGFYYLGARYYESTSGRFLSPDPLGHGSSMSLYDYAGGDPVNFFDPDGREAGRGKDRSGVTVKAQGSYERGGLSLLEQRWAAEEKAETEAAENPAELSATDKLLYKALGIISRIPNMQLMRGLFGSHPSVLSEQMMVTNGNPQFDQPILLEIGAVVRDASMVLPAGEAFIAPRIAVTKISTGSNVVRLRNGALNVETPAPSFQPSKAPLGAESELASSAGSVATPNANIQQGLITMDLRALTTNAANRVDSLGSAAFSAPQQRAILANPYLQPMFRGSAIDKAVRIEVKNDPLLRFLQGSPNRGADFIDPATGNWWDMTTPAQWPGHLQRGYGPGGTLLPTR